MANNRFEFARAARPTHKIKLEGVAYWAKMPTPDGGMGEWGHSSLIFYDDLISSYRSVAPPIGHPNV